MDMKEVIQALEDLLHFESTDEVEWVRVQRDASEAINHLKAQYSRALKSLASFAMASQDTSSDYEVAEKLGLTTLHRWADGIDHHPMSRRIVDFMKLHDFNDYDDSMCIKTGGDGDNGEHIMYLLDAYFEMIDQHPHRRGF